MNTEAVYTALQDYINAGLVQVADGVHDTSLKAEIAGSQSGEEWTGIRMSRLPVSPVQKKDIAGNAIVYMAFQMVSKQELNHTDSGAIAYCTYLEKLTDKLREMRRARVLPALPDGVTLRNVEAVQQPSLNFTDATYSGYIVDLRFILKVRSA